MKLHEKIRAVREAKGLSKKDFGQKLHCSGSWIGEIEKGEGVPSDSLLDLMMAKFNVSVDWWEADEGPMFDAEKKLPLDTRRELAFSELERAFVECNDGLEKLELTADVVAFLDYLSSFQI